MPGEPASSLRGRVLRGVAWKVISQVFGQGASTIVAIIPARLLLPSDRSDSVPATAET